MQTSPLRWLVVGGLALAALGAWWWLAPRDAEAPPTLAAPGPELRAAAPSPAAEPVTPRAPAEPDAPTWRLTATVVNLQDPRASMAWISLDGGEPRLMRVGEGTGKTQVLLAIGPQSVRVGRADGRDAVELPVRPLAAAPLVPRPRPPEVEVSPIVPPHADMEAPPPNQSGTPDSPWAKRRAASAP